MTIKKTNRADKRLAKLIAFHESRLSHSDSEVAATSASILWTIISEENRRKDERAERDVRKLEAEVRKALVAPVIAPGLVDAQIAKIRAEIANGGNA